MGIHRWRNTDPNIERLQQDYPALRFAVFCSDLPEQTVAEAETIRFMLLESGATAVNWQTLQTLCKSKA